MATLLGTPHPGSPNPAQHALRNKKGTPDSVIHLTVLTYQEGGGMPAVRHVRRHGGDVGGAAAVAPAPRQRRRRRAFLTGRCHLNCQPAIAGDSDGDGDKDDGTPTEERRYGVRHPINCQGGGGGGGPAEADEGGNAPYDSLPPPSPPPPPSMSEAPEFGTPP